MTTCLLHTEHLFCSEEPLEFPLPVALERVIPDLGEPTLGHHDGSTLVAKDDPADDHRAGGFMPDNEDCGIFITRTDVTPEIFEISAKRK
jgi:hypothetical protein